MTDKFNDLKNIASECDIDRDVVGRLDEITNAIDELVEAKVFEIMRRSFANDQAFPAKSDLIEQKKTRVVFQLAKHIESVINPIDSEVRDINIQLNR